MKKFDEVIEIRNFKGTRAQLLSIYPQVANRSQYRPVEVTPGESDGLWICGRNLEDEFSIGETYATREAAIEGARDELGSVGVGEQFAVGQLSYITNLPSFPISIERLIEDASENLSGDWHDAVIENWTDRASVHEADLEHQLEEVWDKWVERHKLEAHGYTVDDISHHIMGEEADAEEEVVDPEAPVAP